MPLVVSYFTPNSPYEKHARRLSRSLDRFGLAHRVEARPALGSWVENCAQKARFVRDMHRETNGPILWIDADARVHRPLTEFRGLDADFAVVRREGWSFYAGQIYFGRGEKAAALIERWCWYCARRPEVWDQVSLGYAWWDLAVSDDIKAEWLPETISAKLTRNRVTRPFQKLFTPASILHLQESRHSKETLPAARRSEFCNDDLPRWWRDAARRDAPFRIRRKRLGDLGLLKA